MYPNGHFPPRPGSGSRPSASRPGAPQPRPAQPAYRSMVSPGAPQTRAPPSRTGAPPMPPQTGMPVAHGENPRLRKLETDQLIRDCYSKTVTGPNGQVFPDTTYQTHINIKEFPLHPSAPPPAGTPLSGTKNRVLVICVKHSGRVLLQKGKYNDQKNVYQIGRTWDMDELKAVTRTAADGFILSLNKDYFWKTGDALERVWKFIRSLTSAYGGFVGKYPVLKGYTLADLKLPPTPQKIQTQEGLGASKEIVLNEPKPDPEMLRSKSLKKKNLPTPLLRPEPQSENLYQDLDFTANGKLPQKPMMVMQVDRPGGSSTSLVSDTTASTQVSVKKSPATESREFRNDFIARSERLSHPYLQRSPNVTNAPDNDSHSFIFDAPAASEPEKNKSLVLLEYVKASNPTSPLRNYKNERAPEGTRNISEPLENAAALGLRLEERLNDPNQNTHSFELAVPPPVASQQAPHSPDFGIEEVEDDSDGSHDRKEMSHEFIEESTKLEPNAIDTSIQEIEAYMDSQLYFEGKNGKEPGSPGPVEEQTSQRTLFHNSQATSNYGDIASSTREDLNDIVRSNFSIDSISTVPSMAETVTSETTDSSVVQPLILDKDAEIEELLDEVNWNVTEDSSVLIKKLSKQLVGVKHSNVRELISLDVSKDSDDLTTSLNEIENLSHIFKKMEIDFKLLSPEINMIENNTQGLQVKSVNKKLLYNELKGILDKVNMSPEDLRLIESFKDFQRAKEIPAIENKLLILYGALGTIGSGDDFGTMNALKQYQYTYEKVTGRFIKHFNAFFIKEFEKSISNISVERVIPQDLFLMLNELSIYSGLTNFVKSISMPDFNDVRTNFNQLFDSFFDRLIAAKLKSVNYSRASSRLSDSFDSHSIRKSRNLRLSMRKEKFKIHDNDDTPQPSAEDSKTKSEIEDPKAVLQLIGDSKDLIFVLQFFLGNLFHYDTNISDFATYVQTHPYESRLEQMHKPDIHNSKHYSNDLILNMNAVFGSYINTFLKRVTPGELSVPLILVEVDMLMVESEKKNQEFLVFNFLKKIVEKFRGIWNKFIKVQVAMLDKSGIKSGGQILPAVKNLNQLLLSTETSLQNLQDNKMVRDMLDKSYKELTKAAVHLFLRDDPLLKSNDHDDKERQHRNVSILQNIFYVTQQLDDLEHTGNMKKELDSVFKQVQDAYFDKLLHKNIGKLIDYVTAYEASGAGQKKIDKKYLRTLVSNYTQKDTAAKAQEIFRKLEKNFITGNDMFEQDLLRKLWHDMETQFVDYFGRFSTILRSVDRDGDATLGRLDIHLIFAGIYR